ncbi:hypothetical protein GmHk_07G020498 [Glycine max]|nr:hypothetical protein GmHk_07G020498 [Glycine max]
MLVLMAQRKLVAMPLFNISGRDDVLAYEETSPCVSWWSNKSSLLLTINGVKWTPYQELQAHHLFENISLFFGFIRLGPNMQLHLLKNLPTTQQVDDRWINSQNHLIQPVVNLIDCDVGYYEWFYKVSRPFVQARFSTPPPCANMNQAHTETCHRIGLLLQCMTNHRLVTQGTDAY